MRDRSAQRRELRKKLEARQAIIAPGVFDMISAKIADAQDFDAIYMTGYGISASYLGLPDAGLASYADMVNCVRRIAEGCQTPLIADGDTGYGGALNVRHTVMGYENCRRGGDSDRGPEISQEMRSHPRARGDRAR